MPQIFGLNQVDPWPPDTRPWISTDATKLRQWPTAQTNRTDIRFRLPSDPLFRPIASRHYGTVRCFNTAAPAGDLLLWYWYDLVAIDVYHLRGETGIMDAGITLVRDLYWLPELPFFKQTTGQSRQGVRVVEQIQPAGEPLSTRVWEYPNRTVSGQETFRFFYNRQQPIVSDFGWPQPSNIFLSHMPNATIASGNYPQRWSQWFICSETYDLSSYEE